MTDRVPAFLAAARSAEALLTEPAVAAGWTEPSALPEMSVGGLAAHLAFQVVSVTPVLSAPDDPSVHLVGLREYYERAGWRGAGPQAEVNAGIRAHAEDRAHEGPRAVAAAVRAARAELETALPDVPPARPVASRALRLDDFLLTRMMEIAVHSDDLAVSVGLPTPDLPLEVLEPVLSLLIGLAAGRHGQAAVLRALARVERAPATINAL
jgi:hypothetical protein